MDDLVDFDHYFDSSFNDEEVGVEGREVSDDLTFSPFVPVSPSGNAVTIEEDVGAVIWVQNAIEEVMSVAKNAKTMVLDPDDAVGIEEYFGDRSPFIPYLIAQMNSSLARKGKPLLRENEVDGFMEAVAAIMFYNKSPTVFFSSSLAGRFLPTYIQPVRFFELLSSFDAEVGNHERGVEWNEKFKYSRLLRDGLRSFSSITSRFYKFSRNSVIALDDHKFSNRSPDMSTQAGMERVYHRNERAGPQNYVMSSDLSGIVIAEVPQEYGESKAECCLRLARYAFGADSDRDIMLHGALIALDRGIYSPRTISKLSTQGAHVVATVPNQRGVSAFTLYEAKNKYKATSTHESNPLAVNKIGPKRATWAISTDSSGRNIYYLAYRPGVNGKVALLATTRADWALPNRWTIVQDPSRRIESTVVMDCKPLVDVRHKACLDRFDAAARMLTASTGDACWHQVRKLKLTGSMASVVFSAVSRRWYEEKSRYSAENAELIESLLTETLELDVSQDPPQSAYTGAPLELPLSEVEHLDVRQLRDKCRELKIARYSKLNKSDLVYALTGVRKGDLNAATLVLPHWYQKSAHQSATRMGLENEVDVLKGIPAFITESCSGDCIIEVCRVWRVGFLQSRIYPWLGTSADGIAVFDIFANVDENDDEIIESQEEELPYQRSELVAIEIKTLTSPGEAMDRERDLAGSFGAWVGCSYDETDLFSDLVPHSNHRAQILHHAAVMDCTSVLYVVAQMGSILRVVLVTVSEEIRRQYLTATECIRQTMFGWLQSSQYLAAHRQECEASIMFDAMDMALTCDDIIHTLQLSEGLLRYAAKVEYLPVAKRIVPVLVEVWNHAKVGVDSFSRLVANVNPPFQHLQPLATMWLHEITAALVNSYQIKNCILFDRAICSGRKRKEDFGDINSLRHFLRSNQLFVDFLDTFRMFFRRRAARFYGSAITPSPSAIATMQSNADMIDAEAIAAATTPFDPLVAATASRRKMMLAQFSETKGVAFRRGSQHFVVKLTTEHRKDCALCPNKKTRYYCKACHVCLHIHEENEDEEDGDGADFMHLPRMAPDIQKASCWEKFHEFGNLCELIALKDA